MSLCDDAPERFHELTSGLPHVRSSLQVSHQVGARLVRVAYLDASWLVRSELVVAFAGLARQFEVQLCAMALCSMQECGGISSPVPPATACHTPLAPGRPPRVSIASTLDPVSY